MSTLVCLGSIHGHRPTSTFAILICAAHSSLIALVSADLQKNKIYFINTYAQSSLIRQSQIESNI